jgi:hypothetical protein
VENKYSWTIRTCLRDEKDLEMKDIKMRGRLKKEQQGILKMRKLNIHTQKKRNE